MNKKQIKQKILQDLQTGKSKSEIYSEFNGQKLKDNVLAAFIAGYADPKLCEIHAKKIDVLIVIAWIQLVLGTLLGIGLGSQTGWVPALIISAVIAAFCYIFVWGYSNHKLGVYNASILLSVINVPRAFDGFMEAPILNAILLLINLALICFTWHVRGKIFPDVALFGPRKENGRYLFTS